MPVDEKPPDVTGGLLFSFVRKIKRIGHPIRFILSKNLGFSGSLPVLLVPRCARNGAKPQSVGCTGKARAAHDFFLTV